MAVKEMYRRSKVVQEFYYVHRSVFAQNPFAISQRTRPGMGFTVGLSIAIYNTH